MGSGGVLVRPGEYVAGRRHRRRHHGLVEGALGGLEIAEHLLRPSVAQCAGLLQRLLDHAPQRGRAIGGHGRVRVGNRIGNGHHVVAGEGLAPADHLVEDDGEAKEVAGDVQVAAVDLLRRHVAGRAEHLPVHGDIGLEGQARNPEVGDDHPVARQDLDVIGLDIAVDDPAPVGEGEAFQHLLRQVHRVLRLHCPAGINQVPEGLPLQVLHRDEVAAAGILPNLVNRDDVRVLQRTRRAGLAQKPLEPLLPLGIGGAGHHRQFLDGHTTIHGGVVRFVNDIVRARDFPDDLVLTNRRGRALAHWGLYSKRIVGTFRGRNYHPVPVAPSNIGKGAGMSPRARWASRA